MIDENSLFLWVIGLAFTAMLIIAVLIQFSAGKKPIIELLEGYKENPNFINNKFNVINNSTIIGEIDGINIELSPGLKAEGGMKFVLIIDLSDKPYYTNPRNLISALGKIKFVQEASKVIIPNWEPKALNYGNFDKILNELQRLIDKIVNKESYPA